MGSDEVISLLRHSVAEVNQRAVKELRAMAVRRLHGACKRHGVKPRALVDNDLAVQFVQHLSRATELTALERSAATLLRWCVYGLEQGVNEVAKLQIAYAMGAVDAELAARGKKMSGGTAFGSVGPLRKAIRFVFEAQGDMKNPVLWAWLQARPPKGLTFAGEAGGSLAEVFIEGGIGSKDYTYFVNRAAEERRLRASRGP